LSRIRLRISPANATMLPRALLVPTRQHAAGWPAIMTYAQPPLPAWAPL